MIEYVIVTASDIETFVKKGSQYYLNSASDIKIVTRDKTKIAFSNLSALAKCGQYYTVKKGTSFVAKENRKFLNIEDTEIFWVRDNCLYRFSYEFEKYTFNKLNDLLYEMTESNFLVPVEKNEAYAVAFFYVWKVLSSAKGMPKNISDYALKLKAPSAWRTCSKMVYRGFRLTEEQVAQVKRGQSIELDGRPVSSWTTDKSVAEDFILNFQNTGVILSAKPAELDIILNTDKVKYLPDYMTSEHEVIVRGNGVDTISKKTVAKILG